MYIAMNRFTVFKAKGEDFERRWKDRQSRLAELPGFVEFHLLRCDTDNSDDYRLYASHIVWKSKEDFIRWTKSEQFRDAHKNAGEASEFYAHGPKFEGFESII